MKVQNIMRMQAVVIGFTGALLLASAAPAQEITNTEWPDGPNVSAPAQAVPTAAVPATNDSNAAAAAKPMVSQEAAVSQSATVEGWMIASLLVFSGLLAFYTRAAARHANRNLQTRLRQVKDNVALS